MQADRPVSGGRKRRARQSKPLNSIQFPFFSDRSPEIRFLPGSYLALPEPSAGTTAAGDGQVEGLIRPFARTSAACSRGEVHRPAMGRPDANDVFRPLRQRHALSADAFLFGVTFSN